MSIVIQWIHNLIIILFKITFVFGFIGQNEIERAVLRSVFVLCSFDSRCRTNVKIAVTPEVELNEFVPTQQIKSKLLNFIFNVYYITNFSVTDESNSINIHPKHPKTKSAPPKERTEKMFPSH